MITEQDLLSAIAECQGQKNPNANTCIKLAAYYTILDNITGEQNSLKSIPVTGYSNSYIYKSDSDFMRVIEGIDLDTVMQVIDELMDTLKAVQPRLYDAVMRKFE